MNGLRITPIPRENAVLGWHSYWPIIASAVAVDGNADELDVFAGIASGRSEIAKIAAPGGVALIVTELKREDGEIVCWMTYLGGQIDLRPRGFAALIRGVVQRYEDMARKAGATRMRLGGRRWAHILVDYTTFEMPGVKNGLEKVI